MVEVNRKYIESAINELNDLIGTKYLESGIDILKSLKQSNVREAIKNIAEELTLPVDINLLYEGEISGNQFNSFVSNSLVKYDKYGSEGIYAQVHIPNDLPFYGSPQFTNFEIKVFTNRKILIHEDTFVMVIAHELSHILLESLRFVKKNNEIYVDLVQILLGFGDFYKRGRVIVEKISETQYKKTTIGYLTDDNVSFAYDYIEKINIKNKELKNEFNLKCREVTKCKEGVEKKLKYLEFYLHKLDSKKAPIMKEHTDSIIQMHDLNFLVGLKSRTSKLSILLDEIIKNISILRFNSYAKKILDKELISLEDLKKDFLILDSELNSNIQILLKYLNFFSFIKYKFRI